MEGYAGPDEIVLLFDSYSQDSQRLHESFQLAGYDCLVIVIDEDCFLLSDLMGNKRRDGKRKYFDEIIVPDDWEISAGDEKYGKIHYHHEEKGRIHYVDHMKKYLVKAVDWYDRKGMLRISDHYNRYGTICARTIYNANGQPLNKSWLSEAGREIIVENYAAGSIIFHDCGQVKIFHTKLDLIRYFFESTGLHQSRIFYNSLSTPFFVSQRLGANHKKDVLFWQEPVREDIPGNMQIILKGQATRTDKIMVQKRRSYEKLLELGAREDIIHKLGFIYPFERENGYKPEALICTRSDQVEHCRELIEALPQMHFHIAAFTEMSSKLMSVEVYANVSLYPGISTDLLKELFKRCDYYFDINHWAEMDSAVWKAFLNNHLIFAFEETIHNREYVADEHIYRAKDFSRMISDVRAIMGNRNLVDEHIKKQHEAALSEDKESFIRYFQ